MLDTVSNIIAWSIAGSSFLFTVYDTRRRHDNYFFIDIMKFKVYRNTDNEMYTNPLLKWNTLEDWNEYFNKIDDGILCGRGFNDLMYDEDNLPQFTIKSIGESVTKDLTIDVRFDSMINFNDEEEIQLIDNSKTKQEVIFTDKKNWTIGFLNSYRQTYYYETIPKDFDILIDFPGQFISQFNLYLIGKLSYPPILNIEIRSRTIYNTIKKVSYNLEIRDIVTYSENTKSKNYKVAEFKIMTNRKQRPDLSPYQIY